MSNIIKDFSLTINELIARGYYVIRMGSIVKEKFSYSKDLIVPVKSSDIKFDAKRPKNTSFKSNKISNYIDIEIPSIDYSLKLIRGLW